MKYLLILFVLIGCESDIKPPIKDAKVITCTKHYRVPTKCGTVAAFLIEDTKTKERFWATHPDIKVNENQFVEYEDSGWVSLEIYGRIVETKRLIK